MPQCGRRGRPSTEPEHTGSRARCPRRGDTPECFGPEMRFIRRFSLILGDLSVLGGGATLPFVFTVMRLAGVAH